MAMKNSKHQDRDNGQRISRLTEAIARVPSILTSHPMNHEASLLSAEGDNVRR